MITYMNDLNDWIYIYIHYYQNFKHKYAIGYVCKKILKMILHIHAKLGSILINSKS